MTFFDNIFFAFWFFLPAGLANMFPIFVSHLPVVKNWNLPMDFYFNFRGRPIFGSNKTIRGLVTAVVVGILTAISQRQIFVHWDYLQQISPINYVSTNVILLGTLLGLGAILGDAVESFFKRQFNISEGDSWFFFDQIDYILGGIILSYWFIHLNGLQYLYLILVYFVLHLASTIFGYLFGLKRQPI
jgi:CDP-2,3-bis-(O-geranylgeranyl)-sn-glycerol synthase